MEFIEQHANGFVPNDLCKRATEKLSKHLKNNFTKVIRTTHFKNRVIDRNVSQSKVIAAIQSPEARYEVVRFKQNMSGFVALQVKIHLIIDGSVHILVVDWSGRNCTNDNIRLVTYYKKIASSEQVTQVPSTRKYDGEFKFGDLVYLNHEIVLKESGRSNKRRDIIQRDKGGIFKVATVGVRNDNNSVILMDNNGYVSDYICEDTLTPVSNKDDLKVCLQRKDYTFDKTLVVNAVVLGIITVLLALYISLFMMDSTLWLVSVCFTAIVFLIGRHSNTVADYLKERKIQEKEYFEVRNILMNDFKGWTNDE